jgi:hypothetical protein
MITAMVLMMIFGGSTPEIFVRDDFRAVSQVIEEEQRAAAVTQSMENINSKLERVMNQREAVFESLSNVDDLVGAEQAEYEAIIGPLWNLRREADALYIDEVFEMRSNMTREEWGQTFGSTPQ